MLSTVLMPDTLTHDNALNILGLKIKWLNKIGLRALAAYNQATPNDAANAAGSYAYFAAVRAMRDILCPKGWGIERKHNLEFIKYPEGTYNLITSSGDRNTGIKNGTPKTMNSKGSETQRVVDTNATQLFFSWWPNAEALVLQKDASSVPTWFLLYHIDVTKEVRMELSLPIKVNLNDLKVDEWKQRLILPCIEFSPTPTVSKPDFAPEIEFKIKRKNEA